MSAARYVGELTAVTLEGGRRVPCHPVALGVVDGVGLVTARTRAALEAGRFLRPARGQTYRRATAVFYDRDRTAMGFPGGSAWRHPLKATAFAVGPDGPTFLRLGAGAPANICPMAGDFICEG